MNTFLIITISTIVCGGLSFSLEAIFGSHDPGAVFPWLFVAMIMGGAGALVGFLGSSAVMLFRWMLGL